LSFAPIHNHTEYSALDGLATAREIAIRCTEIGCSCCGITDHGTVSGHLEFAKTMAEYDIKPIFGCELYHGVKTEFAKQERDQSHFIAGAITDEGLRNLWRLVDDASTNYRFVGRVNWNMLKNRSEGLFATSACIQGLVAQGIMHGDPYEPLNKYLDIFGDNFYIEIHTYPGDEHMALNSVLVDIARERGIPLIYATDAHFASPEQYELHDAFVAMQTGENIYMPTEERKMWHPKSLYIQDEAQIRQSLSYLPESAIDEALRNSAELADKCNAQLPEVKRHLPVFIPKDSPWTDQDVPASSLFFSLVEKGIVERYGENASDEVWDRVAREMEVFIDAGLEHYFLQAWDFCEFCNKNEIKRGPGRGSAAGAIVSYALGITDIDPLKYGLIFERFYNPGREDGYPDIDNDFPVAERKRVRQYLKDRWGDGNVRTIGTITRLKPKAALDRTYKACDISWDEKEELKSIIDAVPDIDILGADSIGWSEDIDPGKTIYVMNHVGDQIFEWADNDRRRYWLDILETITSRISGYGVHPSGVVVSDVVLNDELPCMWNRQQEEQVTCFPMTDVDKRMFVKQDLLGLRNLDTLQEWEDESGNVIDWSNVDDGPEEMWQMLDQGLTLGIFQIERGYAKQLCKEFKPRSIEDLGIIVSLNRPGPIRSGAPDSFIRRRNGDEEISYDHPILEDILEPTYGWFLYQEQVIAFFNKLGYSLSESDAVRKILGKKKPEQMIELYNGEGEWENRGFVDVCLENNIDRKTLDVIWNKLEDFAKYSFNKSHAIAYATIAFRTLYAKYMASAEFLIACIRTNPDAAGEYVSEGRRMGINVLTPDILKSQEDIAVIDGEILFGFSNIKGVGKGAAAKIVEIRQRHDLSSPEKFEYAIDCEQDEWDWAKEAAQKNGTAFKQRSPRQTVSASKVPALLDAGAWDDYQERDVSLTERQTLERQLLGVIITDKTGEVFAVNQDLIDECDSYTDLEYADDMIQVRLPGVISNVQEKRTKKDNKAMGIVNIEYQGDATDFVVFPQDWHTYKILQKEMTPGIFTLTKTSRGVRFNHVEELRK
jgi:DNA polymerase III subunit alpha